MSATRRAAGSGRLAYVLSGKLRIDRRMDAEERAQPDAAVAAGEYFFAPAGEIHEGYAEEDTTLLVVAPGGLVPTVAGVPK
jgi:quercetin dioxygenase-like cupin family protein